jgi:hypothetical protein
VGEGSVRGTEADSWSSKISAWLVGEAQSTWRSRNEELHMPTTPDNQHIARAALELQERVRELYARKDNVNYQDRDLFEITLDTRLQQSVSILRAWVESTSKTLGICSEDFAAATARGNRDIRDHLQVRTRVPTSKPVAVVTINLRREVPTDRTTVAARPADIISINNSSSSSGSSISSSSSSSSNNNMSRISKAGREIRAAIKASKSHTTKKSKDKPKTPAAVQREMQNIKATHQDSDTETQSSDSEQESKEPPIVKRFTPRPKVQQTLDSYFGRERNTKQHTPKVRNNKADHTKQKQQEWFSPQPDRCRQREVSTGSRRWDAARTAREGGGGPARVAKFRDRSTQQLGSAADSAPVVL